MTIAMGADEAAFELKETIKKHLIRLGYEVADYGVHSLDPVLYPDIAIEVAEAIAEGNKVAEISFRNANAVEKIHYGLYGKALAAIKGGNDLEAKQIWVCGICGNTVEGNCPNQCPVCMASKDKFSEIK